MRKLISLQQLIDRAEEDGMDPRDLAVDADDVYSLNELDDENVNPLDEE